MMQICKYISPCRIRPVVFPSLVIAISQLNFECEGDQNMFASLLAASRASNFRLVGCTRMDADI